MRPASQPVTLQPLSSSFEATTPHVRCAVHGEQTHAITHGTGQVGAPTIGGDQIANRADDIVAEHEHCGIVATAHALFARPAAPTLITDAAVPIAIAPPIAAAPIARATFRLAPKTSPPV